MKIPMPPIPLAAALTSALLMGLVGCAHGPLPTDSVPPALEPGTQMRTLTTVSATGVQVYECRLEAAAAKPAWAFVAPEAELFDGEGIAVGSHGGGPHWTNHDGSRVVGSLRARVDAPVPGAIPWLLLATRSTGAAGVLSPVTYIQRLHTQGGVAPASGCEATTVGRQARVSYRADYRLLVPA